MIMKKKIIIGYTNSKNEEKRVAKELYDYFINIKDIDVEMGKVNYITYYFTGDDCKNIEFRKLTDTEDSKLKVRIQNKQVGYGYAYYTVQYFGYEEGNVLLYRYRYIVGRIFRKT